MVALCSVLRYSQPSEDCRNLALDFANNASLAAVNITNVLRKQTKIPFSIDQIESLIVNAHFIKRFLTCFNF